MLTAVIILAPFGLFNQNFAAAFGAVNSPFRYNGFCVTAFRETGARQEFSNLPILYTIILPHFSHFTSGNLVLYFNFSYFVLGFSRVFHKGA